MRVFLVLAAHLGTTSIALAAPALCAFSGPTAAPPTPSAPTSPTTRPPLAVLSQIFA
jgi:hypothetical protein